MSLHSLRALHRLVLVAFAVLLMLLAPTRSHAEDNFLEPEQAFKLAVRVLDERSVEARIVIAPGYYMYREQFKFEAPGGSLVPVALPDGKRKFDQTFNKEVETYRDELRVVIGFAQAEKVQLLTIKGQGCADQGLCYPPIARTVAVKLSKFGAQTPAAVLQAAGDGLGSFGDAGHASVTALASAAPASTNTPPVKMDRLGSVLESGKFWWVVGLFFVAGVGLSFTPCVLPMVPILASIIVGGGATVSRRRGFALALSYSQGMALVYTGLGVAAALAGEGLAAYFQSPIVLSAFGVLLALFSLSLFGAYELRLPSGMANSLNDASQRLAGGKFVAVFVMGAVSALLVSACVTGVLASALLYLSRTGDVWLGGAALYAMANGMSVPLLLLGLSAGSLLPRAGPWMDGVKHFFGMLLLGLALWTVEPVLPAEVTQALLGALLVGAATGLGAFKAWHPAAGPRAWMRKTLALAALAFGLLQWLGAAAGGTDMRKPMQGVLGMQAANAAVSSAKLSFRRVQNLAELNEILRTTSAPVMLDFYADWCKSCIEMETHTFTDDRVRQRLASVVLLKADVTANSEADRALLKRFNLFGPPGIVFFDAQGKELDGRVIGFQDPDRFINSVNLARL